MAVTITHRILGLFALLAASLLFAGTFSTQDTPQNSLATAAFDGANPGYIAIKNIQSPESSCVHTLEHPHESCRTCTKPFILRSAARVRTRTTRSGSKADNPILMLIQVLPVAMAGIRNSGAISEQLSQAALTDAGVIARTGRLRI